jgi:hypothetical protein
MSTTVEGFTNATLTASKILPRESLKIPLEGKRKNMFNKSNIKAREKTMGKLLLERNHAAVIAEHLFFENYTAFLTHLAEQIFQAIPGDLLRSRQICAEYLSAHIEVGFIKVVADVEAQFVVFATLENDSVEEGEDVNKRFECVMLT